MSEDEKIHRLKHVLRINCPSRNKPLPKARILGGASPSAARIILSNKCTINEMRAITTNWERGYILKVGMKITQKSFFNREFK